jgi:SAM-dependent methyltransferase
MLDMGMLSFVLETLPPPPLRVLEVGAGDGELASALGEAGYDVVGIDPASETSAVRRVSLHALSEPAGSFDAAVAVLSLHHVEPLNESCARLAEVMRPGGVLVLDEIDFGRFDERAAAWWLEQHGGASNGHGHSPAEIVAHHRDHCHLLTRLQAALDEWFELTAPVRGPYLYRWDLGPELRATEVELIARGELAATGARMVGRRK